MEIRTKMIGRLLVAAVVLSLSEQAYVMEDCGCGQVEIFEKTTTAAYCPITQVRLCNSSKMVNGACSISCPYYRGSVFYRNATATYIKTSSIKCENNMLRNDRGSRITMLQRPTCGFAQECNNCPHTYEDTACPAGQTCNPANFKRSIDPEDDCGRMSCDNSATLTLYDENKAVIPFIHQRQIYCLIGNKWANYSLNGGLGAGTVVPSTTFSVNCRLPACCETCLSPSLITDPSQLPEAFKSGYNQETPKVNKEKGQCTTVTCPDGYRLMGFVGTAVQTGIEKTSQNMLVCAENGQWSNNGFGYTPQPMKFTCLQKITLCPPVDVIIGNSNFEIACNERFKETTLSCPGGQKLIMRYAPTSSAIRYERALFIEGKGWQTEGSDSGEESLFTTASGVAISAACTSPR